jgi:anti-sigma factor RsiW
MEGAAMTCEELKPFLNARMDGEIDPMQGTALDSHLERCSSCTTYLEKLKHVRSAIRNEMPYYTVPEDLLNRLRCAVRSAQYLDRGVPGTAWRAWGAVAATLAFCALATVPFLVNARDQSHLVAEELLAAHQRALAGRSVDVVSSDQHTVKPWFNGRLPFSPPTMDLASDGFPLEGGRVDYAGERPIAALVYGRRLHRIDVFVRPAAGEKAPPQHFERNGYNEVSWTKDTFLFTAISDLNATELTAFTRLLQSQ